MGIRDRSYMRDRSMFGDDSSADWEGGVGFWRSGRAVGIALAAGLLAAGLPGWGLAGSLSRKAMAAQAAAGWALGAVALILGIGLVVARRPVGWVAVVLGAAGIGLGVAVEIASR